MADSVNVTPSSTQRRSMITPTDIPGISSRSKTAPRGTPQADSPHQVVPSLASGIASIPTPLRGLENLLTPIASPDARATITNSLRTGATERIQRQTQCQLQPQAESTAQSVVSSSYSIDRFGHSDMTHLVFVTGSLMELYMWNKQPFVGASDFERVSYGTQRAGKQFSEAPHLQTIAKYWYTAMQQNNIWFIAFEACAKEILKDVCCSDRQCGILHAQCGTRFEHKSTKLNTI